MTAKQLFKIVPLSAAEINYLQSLAPTVKESGVVVTTTMYNYMFKTFPEVKTYFNMTNQKTGRQPKVLAYSLYQYILHLNDLTPISGFVKQIVTKHVGLNILPEQYPIVGQCLIHAFKEVLGPAADDHFVSVLGKAYGNLAQILIDMEEEGYQKLQWRGFKDFKVTKVVKEAQDVTSVYMTPVDGTALKTIIPGQYIAQRWDVDSEIDSREYSISHELVNNEYRISVRNIGKISNYINNVLKAGDIVPVHAPVGNFVYDADSKKPRIAILAGGIGITPMIPIMEAALNDGKNVELHYSNRSRESEPFADYFKTLESKFPSSFKLREYIEKEGQILQGKHLSHINKEDYDIYLLGPVPYMHEFRTFFESKGISEIKMEFFGPTDPDC
jgi:nitric oxide dioxygenase